MVENLSCSGLSQNKFLIIGYPFLAACGLMVAKGGHTWLRAFTQELCLPVEGTVVLQVLFSITKLPLPRADLIHIAASPAAGYAHVGRSSVLVP